MGGDEYTIAIVGVGPRGGHALECLIAALADSPTAPATRVLLFDEAQHLGAGPVYDLEQPESNWINISERALELDERTEIDLDGLLVPAFPGYHEWAGLPQGNWPAHRVDTFPPRAHVGRYLYERTESMVRPLVDAGLVSLVAARVASLSPVGTRWVIADSLDSEWAADEVLLAIGHQPTSLDDQIAGWKDQVGDHSDLMLRARPYPIAPILDHARSLEETATVAIRGYGLAMMDVVRGLALGFGEFRSTGDDGELIYQMTADAQLRMVPFSLDGLPMSPKPLTSAIDASFAPTDAELRQLGETLEDPCSQAGSADASLLIDAIAPLAARVFLDLPQRHPDAPTDHETLESLIRDWLRDADVVHDSINAQSSPPKQVLAELVRTAVGRSPVSVDYCVGQVWRHCHPTIYASLSYNQLDPEALAATIALDERIKRYSFGPPVESIRQLIALADAGVLDLGFVNDPDITLERDGWTLSSDSGEVTASVMVDSVLDDPQLEKVVTPLVTTLLENGELQPVHDELGIATYEDATVCTSTPDAAPTLAVLGRLAKGTVIGVDAILECFGTRPQAWAEGAVKRITLAPAPPE